jgi:nucleoside-diphosphate-sugar epimerase
MIGPMSRCLIVGCGSTGSVLAAELVAEGQTVFALRRSDGALPTGVQRLRADVAEPLPQGCLPDDLDTVVYAVAAKSREERVYRAAYVDGLAHVLAALSTAKSPPRRVIFTSSTAVYGQHSGEWIDETSATEPASFSGRILLEAEARLAEAAFETCSLRLGGIYGPGRTSRLRSVAEGRATVRAGAPQYTNRIHRDDAAGALAHLLRVPTLPAVVLGIDDEPADERAVLEWMAQALGVAAPEVVTAEEAAPPRAGSKRCRNALLRSLGWVPRYPTYREGYASLLREVLATGTQGEGPAPGEGAGA